MNKPKLIYYNDARHYSFYRYDPPMSLHQLRQPIDELLGTGVDTLSYGLASGQTFFHDTKVGIPWGDVGGDHNHGVMWWRTVPSNTICVTFDLTLCIPIAPREASSAA